MSTAENQISDDIQENRRKLAEKLGNKVGGKNVPRRKQKPVVKAVINDDKKLKQIIKKYGLQPFPGVDEVNFFKDDNTILHFKRPEVQAAVQNNSFAIFGLPESKTFSDLMPEIIQHIGPKQFGMLKDLMGPKDGKNIEKIAEEPEDDDVPDLVGAGQNFEETSNK